MIILDRTKAPEIRNIENLNIRRPMEEKLSNGMPVFLFDVSEQDFVKIELNFDAGSARSAKALIAGVTNKLLSEGTRSHSASEIAELIDSYGGFFETNITKDVAAVALYTLNKHLENTLPLLAEIIREAVFPKEELELHLAQKRNEFLVNKERVNFIARSHFPAILFGEEHPYGRILKTEDFNKVQRQDLVNFHQDHYISSDARIFVAGKVSSNITTLLERYFGDMQASAVTNHFVLPEIKSSNTSYHFIAKESAVQNALRIGKTVIGRQHPDSAALRIVNTILGGYFGSRLMTNIREDKGYTYGIGSGIMNLQYAAFFFITSEVKSEVSEMAVTEIFKEIEKLQQQPVGEEELTLVRNYLQGEFQRSFDGPFALLNRFKEIYYSKLDYEYFENYIEKVKTITASEIMDLANKYLKQEELYTLIVGKK